MVQLGNHRVSREVFSPFHRRAVIPLITTDGGLPQDEEGSLPDLHNIQGDVFKFPKKAESFIFFRINDVPNFKAALADFQPTTAADVVKHLIAICQEKIGNNQKLPIIFQQIAFSRAGLNLLGLAEKTGDERFDVFCMRDNKDLLGDTMQWDQIFDKPGFDPIYGTANVDRGAIHGIVAIAAHNTEKVSEGVTATLRLFSDTIDTLEVIEGKVRPGQMDGHEHFGFMDGISQPAMRGLNHPRPGQTEVDVGVLITGYEGDPVRDKRPEWGTDGTFMVFRKLEQDVPGFNEYKQRNGPKWREFVPKVPVEHGKTLTDKEGTDLFAARLFGRFQSGAPLPLCPVFDDPELAADKNRNNNFDFSISGIPEPTDKFCPFTAHIRKVNSRNLGPYLDRKFIEASSILRTAIPYGDELPAPTLRGLLFVCYQSNLDSGFVRQTVGFADNVYFPPASLVPQRHGQDTIIGGPDKPYNISLTLSNGESATIALTGFANPPTSATDPPGVPPEYFITSRGGEWFFVPSVSTLNLISGKV
ncbi:hypothetical protein V8B97DRAFT_1971347 [Scleroderma yunnanense]